MSALAIRIDGLSKRYRIGAKQASYRTLRETVVSAVASPLRRLASLAGPHVATPRRDELWALHDISLDIEQGSVVGILGRNGAGKSTLLKILARITTPTRGVADVYGRVSSLLEVGSGFHPELTGRENIYLNGAILGMKRTEIRHKFDDIVDFAELSRFIETPVKRYSSGMYMRLAISVAAHLDPDILLVDEVLAVGDAAFQQKCIGKMGDAAQSGRTVLFVSHNMAALRSLCTHGVLLNDGGVALIGSVEECVHAYMRSIGLGKNSALPEDSETMSGRSPFGRVRLCTADSSSTLHQSRPLVAETSVQLPENADGFVLHCVLDDMQGRRVFHVQTTSKNLEYRVESGRRFRARFETEPLWLNPGMYSLFFRLVVWGDCGKSLYLSEPLPLDVAGQNASADSMLSPEPNFFVEPY